MTPRRIRPPAVAGHFYPADPARLAAEVDAHLAAVAPSSDAGAPKALVVPHAGHRYSGPVAASAYATLRPVADRIRRVVLLGPAHRVALHGLGTSTASCWRTPLGDVELDDDGRSLVEGHPAVAPHDRAHGPEHSLEVHLPFLQRVLEPGWVLLPLVVGRAEPEEVADVVDLAWGGDETLVVVSTDLSHYHPQGVAAELDRATAARILAGDSQIDPQDACGAYPLRGLILAAGRHRLTTRLVDLRTSGDTAGDRSRVVGYGSFTLYERAGS